MDRERREGAQKMCGKAYMVFLIEVYRLFLAGLNVQNIAEVALIATTFFIAVIIPRSRI